MQLLKTSAPLEKNAPTFSWFQFNAINNNLFVYYNNDNSFIEIKRYVHTVNQQKMYVFKLYNVTEDILQVDLIIMIAI